MVKTKRKTQSSATRIIGVPESTAVQKRELVVSALMSSATNRINPNAQYNGTASNVVSGDIHRIYVIRRTHGGCLHYLPEVLDCQASYEQWGRMNGHRVHVYNDETVAKLPSLLPPAVADVGELAFALAVAFGWVAKRGPQWFMNLTLNVDKFESQMPSHWNGIAFTDGKIDVASNALQAFVDSGTLVYHNQVTMNDADKLGADLEECQESFTRQSQYSELVVDCFGQLQAWAPSNVAVAELLENYIMDLRNRNSKKDVNFNQIVRMIEVLSEQAKMIRNG